MGNRTRRVNIKRRKKTRGKNYRNRSSCVPADRVKEICAHGFNTFEGSLFNRNKGNLTVKQNIDKVLREYRKYKKNLEKVMEMSHKIKGVDVKDDFYTYINMGWLNKKEAEIEKEQKYYVQFDDFRIVQEKVYYQLIGYVKDYIRKNSHTPKGKSVANLYKCLKNSTPEKGLYWSQYIKNMINKAIEEGDMYDLISYINKSELVSWQCPISWSVIPDEKNVTKYISHLNGPQLGIYDYMIYIDDDADSEETKKYKKEFRGKYIKFIEDTFKTCLPNEYKDYNARDVYDVEYELLDAMGCLKMKHDDPDMYNVVSRKELESVYDFDWSRFSKQIGYKTVPEKVIVASTNGLKCTVELLKKNWNSPKWKAYWLFIFYKGFLRLEWNWNKVHHEFYGKYMKGQPVPFPEEIYPLFPLSFGYNTLLTELYVENNYNPLYVNYVKNMIEDYRTIFINKIKRNNWLMPSTKKHAIKKLEKLNAMVGKPDDLRPDPVLDYCDNDPWYNMRMLAHWRTERLIDLEGKTVIDIPEIDWNELKLVGTQAYVVNAYYTPTNNSIYFPLAYLQKPFIDLDERGIEYNLAYVGNTIGHELSHCLDDMGSKFDEKGNLYNWWTKEDKRKFDAKIKDVVKQYTQAAKLDGIDFDATIGVGENLADISGLSLSEEYLLLFQEVNEDIDVIKKISLDAFYVYCAIQSRQKVYKNAIPAQLKTNPHPLEKYRCNCPLSRLEIFRKIYDVQKGDKMWWHNTDTIW
jgi:putative endopeptidase